jgi:hypothetical protein
MIKKQKTNSSSWPTLQKTKYGTAETPYASDISGCSSASTCQKLPANK